METFFDDIIENGITPIQNDSNALLLQDVKSMYDNMYYHRYTNDRRSIEIELMALNLVFILISINTSHSINRDHKFMLIDFLYSYIDERNNIGDNIFNFITNLSILQIYINYLKCLNTLIGLNNGSITRHTSRPFGLIHSDTDFKYSIRIFKQRMELIHGMSNVSYITRVIPGFIPCVIRFTENSVYENLSDNDKLLFNRLLNAVAHADDPPVAHAVEPMVAQDVEPMVDDDVIVSRRSYRQRFLDFFRNSNRVAPIGETGGNRFKHNTKKNKTKKNKTKNTKKHKNKTQKHKKHKKHKNTKTQNKIK
jgi:hypothetical protein